MATVYWANRKSIKQNLAVLNSPCGSTMTCLCARCASRPFSFLPNSRPMDDLMPFFFGCLWRESWLLATLLRALASASKEATILKHGDSTKEVFGTFQFYEIICIFVLLVDLWTLSLMCIVFTAFTCSVTDFWSERLLGIFAFFPPNVLFKHFMQIIEAYALALITQILWRYPSTRISFVLKYYSQQKLQLNWQVLSGQCTISFSSKGSDNMTRHLKKRAHRERF